MLKSNINGNKMFNNANKSISREHHKKGRSQTVENVKYAVNFIRQRGGTG